MERVQRMTPARQFQIFELCVVRGMASGEVATFLNVSAARVYLTKHRVGKLVAAEYKRLELAEQPG